MRIRILSNCFSFCDSKNIGSSHRMNKYSSQIQDLCHRFSLAQLRKSTNNFDKSQIVGIGNYGTVYKGCICIQGVAKEIAVKRLDRNSKQGIRQFQYEVELLCQLRHPNLVSLVGFCNDKDENLIVYEFMPNRSIAYQLHSNTEKPLSWKRRVEFCIGIARGLHYLHAGVKRTIFHGDVKPGNILLDQNWIPKLSYFGFSLKGPHSMSKPKPVRHFGIAGTKGYIAPEYYLSDTLTEKCDVFSFGMSLLEMVSAKTPRSIFEKIGQLECKDVDKRGSESEHLEGYDYEGYDSENFASQVYNFVHNGNYDEIMDPFLMGKIAPECWKVFIDIAGRCLLFEPSERPGMGEVEVELEHALALQEEADHANPSGDYGLLSTVIEPLSENANQD